MAAQNSINNRTTLLTIDPGASADSYVQYAVSGSDKFRMGDDQSASDAFKISIGSALGTSDAFVMTTAGENTMPLQPAFSAYLSSTATDVTGDATLYTLACDTEIFDQQSNYNNSTYTFTAPVDGKYVFTMIYYLGGILSSHTAGYCQIVTSNTTFATNSCSPFQRNSSSGQMALDIVVFCVMDSADTVYVQTSVSNGTKVIDVIGSAAPGTVFQGALIC